MIMDTVVEGVGLNRLTENFMQASIDKGYKVTDEEVLHMAHFLIENEGLLLGSSSALNCCTIVKAVREFGPK
jgi:cysteine synthase A